MNSKLFLLCFIVFCSCLFVSYSGELQSLNGLNPTGGNAGGGGGGPMSCVVKLIPCKPYLKSPSNPPANCCVPMKELVTEDTECLCDVLHNPEIMKSFNVTLDEALNLAKACGANADLSKCKPVATPPASPPATLPTDSPTGGSSSNNTNTSRSSRAAANGIFHFAGLGFIAFLLGL